MPISIYIGNLAFEATEADVQEFFGGFGPVKSIKIPLDRDTSRPRGFGFVEYESREHADTAIKMANGHRFMGRELKVNEARQRGDAGAPGQHVRSYGGQRNDRGRGEYGRH